MSSTLFDKLANYLHGEIDRREECHIPCPDCGHESSPKNPHCSFSEKGFYCFVCGSKYSLMGLANRVNLETGSYIPLPAKPREPEKPASWIPMAETLVDRYIKHPYKIREWQKYKPISRETIIKRRLGIGILPASKCKHERLIVPIIDGSEIVGLRGRSLGCDCGKWLAPLGTRLEHLPLYGEIRSITWIVENPIDALLLAERLEYGAVATYSVSYWREEWIQPLRACDLVIIAYDNDLPGNGGSERRDEFIREYLKTHNQIPPSNGIRLANCLNMEGIRTVLYGWGKKPFKYDIGALIAE